MKTYTRRDSVTAILRKMGIDKADYNNHIITNADGAFSIREQDQTPPWETAPITDEPKTINTTSEFFDAVGDILSGKKKAKDFTGPKNVDTSKAKKETKAEAPKTEKEARRTVSSAAREHILAGHDNKKVFELLQSEFKLDDDKKSYPGWYRSEMKRKVKN